MTSDIIELTDHASTLKRFQQPFNGFWPIVDIDKTRGNKRINLNSISKVSENYTNTKTFFAYLKMTKLA